MLLIPAVSTDAKVYLVSVGITDYPGNDMDLTLPANDAKTIANLYAKYWAMYGDKLSVQHALARFWLIVGQKVKF